MCFLCKAAFMSNAEVIYVYWFLVFFAGWCTKSSSQADVKQNLKMLFT